MRNNYDIMTCRNRENILSSTASHFCPEREDMSNILYTTHCPKCSVLEKKLSQKNIQFEICDNQDELVRVGHENHISSAPILYADDKYMDFQTAIKWVNAKENG